MKEIALITWGKNVTKIELPEGFEACSEDEKNNQLCNTKCPFSYDDWNGMNCIFDCGNTKVTCPFKGGY